MTSSMYVTLADIFKAARDENTRIVLWHVAGDSFSAGNDVEDFLKNPPGPGDSPQAKLMNALIDFDKPLIAAVRAPPLGQNDHADALRLRVCGRQCEVPDAIRQSCCGARIWIELVRSSSIRAHPSGGVDLVGSAFRCQARRRTRAAFDESVRKPCGSR
jgi:hypothetical protein